MIFGDISQYSDVNLIKINFSVNFSVLDRTFRDGLRLRVRNNTKRRMKRQLLKRSLLLSAAVATATLSGYARQPERGYRGFAEWTNRLSHHTYESSYEGETYSWSTTDYSPGISTSHGYQFNPWLFLGAGIDFSLKDIGNLNSHYYHFDNNQVAIFAEGRTDLKFGKFTPFGDIRIGWNAASYGTVYFSPSIGYRFNWGRKVGINVGVGYTLDAYRYEDFIDATTPDGWPTFVMTGEYVNWHRSSFTFRVGIDF